MKPLKKFALLGLVAPLLFSLLSFTNAVAVEGKVVTIRSYETCKACMGGSPKIQIIEEGQSRVIELEKFNSQNPEQNKNLETLYNLIEQFVKAGYKVETSNSGVAANFMITTYILTK